MQIFARASPVLPTRHRVNRGVLRHATSTKQPRHAVLVRAGFEATLAEAALSFGDAAQSLADAAGDFVPVLPSMPSLPSVPSLPSMPGLPSVPSLPSMPSLPAVPVEVTQVSEFMVDHPVATFAGAVGAVLVIPKLVELFVRYLAGPVAVALLAFYVLENPVDAASIVTTVLDFVNDNPIVITIAIVGTAIAGLVPALLTATAATLLVYALLSVSFGTSVPEVQEMQGSFGETVENLQVLGKVAYRTVERLMQQSAEQQ